DLDSEEAFRAATREWDQAAEAYAAHLREITPGLPASLRRLAELGSLHDARVLGMWQAQTRLTIVLQPAGEASRLCVRTYSLVGSPSIDPPALPGPYRSGGAAWLYDEIGIDRDTLFDTAARAPLDPGARAAENGGTQRAAVVFTHDILLSNGWEL